MRKTLYSLLLCCSLFVPSTHADDAQNTQDKAQLLTLIKTLAILADKGEACGEHMNYYGKRALEGAVCKEYAAAVLEHWPSREALDAEVDAYLIRQADGNLQCENCDLTLERIHELRVTVTYFLDYMDFVKTM